VGWLAPGPVRVYTHCFACRIGPHTVLAQCFVSTVKLAGHVHCIGWRPLRTAQPCFSLASMSSPLTVMTRANPAASLQVTQRPGQDNLTMNAIRFLTTVAKSVHSKLFADANVLKQICESIILPNLRVSGCQTSVAVVLLSSLYLLSRLPNLRRVR